MPPLPMPHCRSFQRVGVADNILSLVWTRRDPPFFRYWLMVTSVSKDAQVQVCVLYP